MSAPASASALTHVPVMVSEVLAALAPRDGGIYVDGTFGGGGYSAAILDAAPCQVWGIDRDPAAVDRGRALARRYPGRLGIILGRFGEMDRLLAAEGVDSVDGVALDLGVSSQQIDDPARGFSFMREGPLDMRMGPDGPSAADVVNEASERDLADIIHAYGEERHARRIARAIVEARQRAPITRTLELADIVRRVVPRSPDGLDPATRTFQALRIYVNDELGELRDGLAAAEIVLRPRGRLAVVSFHSLEDRAVKDFLRQRSGAGVGISRHVPTAVAPPPAPTFSLLERGAIKPSTAEGAANPRARSARLRKAERTSAPPRGRGTRP